MTTGEFVVTALFADGQLVEMTCPHEVIRALLDRLGELPVVITSTYSFNAELANGQIENVSKPCILTIESKEISS